MTISPRAQRVINAINRAINQFGESITYTHTTFGALDVNTGDPAETYTNYNITAIIADASPFQILDININIGYISQDERIIVFKTSDYTTANVTMNDELVWNGTRYILVGQPKDIPVFGSPVAYVGKLKRSTTGA